MSSFGRSIILARCVTIKPTTRISVKFYSSKTDEKNVVKSFCKDVKIDPMPLTNFIWDKSRDRWPDKVAMVNGISGKSHTYSEAYEQAKAFGSALVKRGYSKGDVLALLLPNSPEYITAITGAIGIGCTTSNMNPAYMAQELARQIKMCRAKGLLTTKETLSKALEAIVIADCSVEMIIMDAGQSSKERLTKYHSFEEMVSEGTDFYPDSIPNFNFKEDVANLIFSSGTTGLSKAVMLTHSNIVSGISQIYYSELEYMPPTTETFQPTTICTIPMFHILGLQIISFTFLHCGGKIVILPTFEPKTFIRMLEEYKPTTLNFPPPLVSFCANSPDVKPHHLECLIDIKVGAAPVGESLINKFKEKAPNVIFKEGFGMSELGVTTATGNKNIIPGSCGFLVPNTEAKIIDLKTGEALGPNLTGELCIRGPHIMKGYLDNETATRETITDDGWLHTGDIAKYDETHHFYIVDRLKELIKVKGFQVPPAELEDLIRSHPEIEDIAVIGIPDVKSGEVPRAYVKKKSVSNITEKEIHEFVNSQVAKYKRLHGGIEFVDSIPKSAAGKILRKDLRSMYEKKKCNEEMQEIK